MYCGRQQRPDMKVLHFHISTLLSAAATFYWILSPHKIQDLHNEEMCVFRPCETQPSSGFVFRKCVQTEIYSCSHTCCNNNGRRNVLFTYSVCRNRIWETFLQYVTVLQKGISWEKVGNEIFIAGHFSTKVSEVMISRPRGWLKYESDKPTVGWR